MAIITPKIKYGNINKGNIRFLIKNIYTQGKMV